MSRQGRRELKKQMSDTNSMGIRLYWIRDRLKLKLTEVCQATAIPYASYCDREAGARTTFYEELFILADYFDRKWQDKYAPFRAYPTHKGKDVVEISIMWLMFGRDTSQETYNQILENIRDDFKARTSEIQQENEDLRGQMDLIKFIESQGQIGIPKEDS